MSGRAHRSTLDGNEAATSVAYRASEVIAIYPITPASPMGELADAWAAAKRPNLWGAVPDVVEMQSEAGAAGAVHGALQAGALTTTFTASQGLLLMLPNMYKIAGELTPMVLHVAARTVATHALSIFCDHSDVMAARQTGFALLCSGSVQEAHDLAAIAHAATLESRIPFVHFFDGFRTSHELQKIELVPDEALADLLDPERIREHRRRALSPDHPVIRGTAQNPDTFFQAREAANRFYDACPGIVQATMDRFARATGRSYRLFEYHGHPQAERVVVLMGSSAETAHETVDALNASGQAVGLLRVRLYRPFDVAAFLDTLPATVQRLAVLDRTKEPGAVGDPLYLDVVTALAGSDRHVPLVAAGRYGLSSKEFDPACVRAVFAELAAQTPRRSFTVGIEDDVTHLSLPVDRSAGVTEEGVSTAVFFGLGSDGTVSANKNTIKIIGEATDLHVQGFFVYDSKKAGATTVSHLRFGSQPIRSTYLVSQADFVGCHQFQFLDVFDIVEVVRPGGTLLLNSPYGADEVWDRLPLEVQEGLIDKQIELWVIDAYRLAREASIGGRINTIMQACHFHLAGILPPERSTVLIKEAIETTYGKRGRVIVERNFAAVDAAVDGLTRVEVPAEVSTDRRRPPVVPSQAPEHVQKVTAVMIAGKGDSLPVSSFPVDGTWPTGTSRWEKRNIAASIPIWDPGICIQCNQCALVCPHAAIRAKAYEEGALAGAPESFVAVDYRAPDLRGLKYTIQVAPEDCTGCGLCVEVCPAKDRSNPRHKAIDMTPQLAIRDRERDNYSFFLSLPELDRSSITRLDAKGSQFLEPLFEYSGACAGCGETPYLKLLTQLFGDRLLIANATGCSSIYGGNLPTTPYTVNDQGRGPAWSNSLFEDNAEFGLGFRLAIDQHRAQARELLGRLSGSLGDASVAEILAADQTDETGIEAQRRRVEALLARLASVGGADARHLEDLAHYLVEKSVWLVGGDGWAYDIGYGGLDHVLALGRNVNILVLDTEVYSNTGGQQSKATPTGAAAKFAIAGKESGKKDLGLEAMSYGNVFVAQIAFGAKMNQTVQAMREAESYPGTSLVIAYSPCIAHGYDLSRNVEQQKLLVGTGALPLYRYDPRRTAQGLPPLQLDSGKPTTPMKRFMEQETRFRMIQKQDPERFKTLLAAAQTRAEEHYSLYSQLAEVVPRSAAAVTGAAGAAAESSD
jgi:pyruvate-ferredoxin/flavodoxin oxidoreductase